MSTTTYVTMLVALLVFVGVSSAVNVHVSAGNGFDTYSTGMGGRLAEDTEATYFASVDFSGAAVEAFNTHSVFNAHDFGGETYSYVYTNHFTGNHVEGTYYITHSTLGTYYDTFAADF